jgi:hypothetical protein
VKIDFVASFARLHDNAFPIICRIVGFSHRLAIVAHVVPPKITLVTPTIDFSADFVICNQSNADVVVENECGVPSTVRIEMVDNCNGVFWLAQEKTWDIDPFGRVAVGVSCYSEIHGDYHGMLKLRIRDPWQTKLIRIPLHVKARGSFFDFQKHTLGFRETVDGNTVSFGTEIKVGSGKVIRRLGLVNFSSEAISVAWSISNFVRGRQYATLAFDMDDEGHVKVGVNQTGEANVQAPFKLLTEKSLIESHGKTVIIVEFSPEAIGPFGGCVAARSGEFIHMVDLEAVCVP